MKEEEKETKECLMTSGHAACPGCGGALAMKLALEGLDENTVLVIPACCWTIISGFTPNTCLKVPVFHTAFETTAAVAAGIKAGFEMQGKKVTVVGWAGDGGTFDIGLQALSGAAERGDDIIYICYDNEAYMNTGVQRSSSTPFGTTTTTTPKGAPKMQFKKNMPEIMAAHRVPYIATASVAYPKDLIAKIQKAKEMEGGLRYIQICSPCPPGWRFPTRNTIKIARLAVTTGVYPCFEIFDGEKYTLNYPKGKSLKPLEEYLKAQGRFKELTSGNIAEIQERIEKEWLKLQAKAAN